MMLSVFSRFGNEQSLPKHLFSESAVDAVGRDAVCSSCGENGCERYLSAPRPQVSKRGWRGVSHAQVRLLDKPSPDTRHLYLLRVLF